MMPDIFSIFDPDNNLLHLTSPTLYWLLAFYPMFYLGFPIYATPSIPVTTAGFAKSVAFNQANQTTAAHLKLLPAFTTILFTWIAVVNLGTLLPYSSNPTAHLILTIPLGLPMWLALILSALPFFKQFAAGFLPTGAPNWLASPLVLIESISVFFRPVTLCLRLAANITAGHIIFSLLSTCAIPLIHLSSKLPLIMCIQALAGYCLFEVGICIIQAYIFCLLLTLYSNEHPKPL